MSSPCSRLRIFSCHDLFFFFSLQSRDVEDLMSWKSDVTLQWDGLLRDSTVLRCFQWPKSELKTGSLFRFGN